MRTAMVTWGRLAPRTPGASEARTCLRCLLALAPRTASAVQYEVFIDIETEEDLYDLLVTEQISESSFNALLLLHQTRVELNRASRQRLYLLPNLDYGHVDRILAYRREVGVIHGLGDLVAARVLESDAGELACARS